MGINVEHSPDPSLLGQAGLAIGQGQATQDALRTLSSLGRYGQQQPQSISLQAPHHQSVWEQDHPDGFATPTTGPSVYGTGADDTRPDGAPTEYQQAQQPPPQYDAESQSRLADMQHRHAMVEASDNLTPEQKVDAHQQLDGQFAVGLKYKPLKPAESMEDFVKKNSFVDENGVRIVRDGNALHIIHPPKSNDSDNQEVVGADTSPYPPGTQMDAFGVGGQTPSPQDDFNSKTFTDDQGRTFSKTKDGSYKQIASPPKAAISRDGVSVHDLDALEASAFKRLSTVDPSDPMGKRMIPPSQDKVDAYVDRLLARHSTISTRDRGASSAEPSDSSPAASAPQSRAAQAPAAPQAAGPQNNEELQAVHAAIAQARADGAPPSLAAAAAQDALNRIRGQRPAAQSDFDDEAR